MLKAVADKAGGNGHKQHEFGSGVHWTVHGGRRCAPQSRPASMSLVCT